jgi:hypothetical protein
MAPPDADGSRFRDIEDGTLELKMDGYGYRWLRINTPPAAHAAVGTE